jgi:5'-3' exonuclease
MCSRFETNELIFCWDSRKSYRRLEYKKYKYKRQENKTEEDLESQRRARTQFVTLRREVLPKMGFKNVFLKVGYEADDLIGYFIKKYRDIEFMILSSDNDLYQLIRSNVFMFNNVTKQKMTLRRFKLEYEISPRQWALAKAIGGCVGDSVEGIKGASDPAKSINSKSIKYIKDELSNGVVKDRIESKEGKAIIARNLKLVKLPYYGTKRMNFKLKSKERFKKRDWIEVFDKF